MTPFVEQKRTTQEQQEQRREERSFEHLGAEVHSTIWRSAKFGEEAAKVRDLFRRNPNVFEGMNIADGTNLPNLKNLFVNLLLKAA